MALVIPLLFFVLVWVLFILPQQRRVRAHQALVAALEVGQEVMTTAGLFGVITAIDDDVVHVRVAEGIELRFARAAISQVMPPTDTSTAKEGDAGGRAEPAPDPSPGPTVQRRRGVVRRQPPETDA